MRVVERLRRETGGVAMVGDGINDAPALAAVSDERVSLVAEKQSLVMGTDGGSFTLECVDPA